MFISKAKVRVAECVDLPTRRKTFSSLLLSPFSQSLSFLLCFPFFLNYHQKTSRFFFLPLNMGNCQAVNAAVLVLQHPGGKIDRYYGSVSVSEVMAMYPGHYVSLIIPLTEEEERNIPETVKGDDKKQRKAVRFTSVQLLRPTENLVLGHAYRLITSQGFAFCFFLLFSPRV